MSSKLSESDPADPSTRDNRVPHFSLQFRMAQIVAEQLYRVRKSRLAQGFGVRDEQVLQVLMRECELLRQDVENLATLLEAGVSWEVAYHGIKVGRDVDGIKTAFQNGVSTGQEIGDGAVGGPEEQGAMSTQEAKDTEEETDVAADHENAGVQTEAETLTSNNEASNPPIESNAAPSTTAPSTTAPSTTAPSNTAPNTTAPNFTAPSTTTPDPSLTNPPNNTTQNAPPANPPANNQSTTTTTQGPSPYHITHPPTPLTLAIDTSNRRSRPAPTPPASTAAAPGPAEFRRRDGTFVIGYDRGSGRGAARGGQRGPASPPKSPGYGEYESGKDGKPL